MILAHAPYLIPPEQCVSFFTFGTIPYREQLLEPNESWFRENAEVFAPQSPIRGLGELFVWL